MIRNIDVFDARKKLEQLYLLRDKVWHDHYVLNAQVRELEDFLGL